MLRIALALCFSVFAFAAHAAKDISKTLPPSSIETSFQVEFSFDVTLPPVIIYGTPNTRVLCYGGACADLLADLEGDMSQRIIDLFHLPADVAGEVAKVTDDLASKTDVRCAITSEGLRETTSKSDESTRNLAAIAVYRSLGMYSPARRTVISAKLITVTYADGGEEKWPVLHPMFSNGGIVEPMPGSLKEKDGVVKPSQCTSK